MITINTMQPPHCRALDRVCVVTVTSFIPDVPSTVVPWAPVSPYYDVGGVASITAAQGRGRGGGGQAGAVFINIEPLSSSTTGSSGTNPADPGTAGVTGTGVQPPPPGGSDS